MRKKPIKILAMSLVLLFGLAIITPLALAKPSQLAAVDEANYLDGHRFTEQYWSATVNWVDLVQDALIALNTSAILPEGTSLFGSDFDLSMLDQYEVNTYHAYVNQYNYWMFYSGFQNFVFPNPENSSQVVNGTIPMQSIIQSYRTSSGLTVYSVSTFAFAAAYNEANDNGEIDSGEEVYVLLGFNFGLGDFSYLISDPTIRGEFENLFNSTPVVTTYPITPVTNGYTWGMKYDDLKMLIFKHDISTPDSFDDELLGLIVLDELEFTYTLAFDTTLNRVIINQEYKIGMPTKMITPEPHPDLAGEYIVENTAPDYNLSKFLETLDLSFAIVSFQTTSVINTSGDPLATADDSGAAVTNASPDVDVTDGNFTDSVGDEQIFSVDFSEKPTYNLYNPTGTLNGTYPVETHIYNADGVRGLLANPFILFPMIFINLPNAVSIIFTSDNLINAVRDLLGVVLPYIPNGETIWTDLQTDVPLLSAFNIDFTSNYYVVTYPHWYGYEIVHDPTFVAFADLSAILSPEILAPLVIVGIIAVVVVSMVILRRRRG
jgi:hypothetical protein